MDMDRDLLILPDSRIDNYEDKTEKHLEQIYELIWNAFGFIKPPK